MASILAITVCLAATGSRSTANAGSAQPITDPLNKATATGGNGGQGGNAGVTSFSPVSGNGGNGGNGGAANATASTAILSGPAESDAYSYGGSGGLSGTRATSEAMAARAETLPLRASQRTRTLRLSRATPSPRGARAVMQAPTALLTRAQAATLRLAVQERPSGAAMYHRRRAPAAAMGVITTARG